MCECVCSLRTVRRKIKHTATVSLKMRKNAGHYKQNEGKKLETNVHTHIICMKKKKRRNQVNKGPTERRKQKQQSQM